MRCSGSLTPVLLGFSLLIFGVGVLHAAPSEEQWRTLNATIIEQHLLPRYQHLETSSLAMEKQLQRLCDAPDTEQLDQAKSRFKAAQASWQGIQHIQFGPVTLLMRNHSLQYWPDTKNTGAKQLSVTLAATHPIFDDAFFRSASISIKGFPALERLLFSDDNHLQQPNAVECRLASAIATHIHETALAIQTEWKEEARLIARADSKGTSDDDDEFQAYESPSEAATEFMKSLVEPIEAIHETKLQKPLDISPQKSRWKRSESWRSQQSINNIQQNIIALHELYSGTHPISVKTFMEAAGDHERAASIEKEFSIIHSELAQLPTPSDMSITPALYQALMQVSDHLKTLQSDLEQGMQTLNIQLGFNSRDGD